jgi:hypothetical protein
MKGKSINWGLLFFAGILFVALGDKVLPSPLKEMSTQVRNSVNNFLIGLVPDWKPSVNPYQRTEDALKKEEKQGK